MNRFFNQVTFAIVLGAALVVIGAIQSQCRATCM